MKNYLQRLRCKSRINCQIPGTEPKGKRGKSTVAFSVQVPLPELPLRVTDGDRKRRPRHLPGAPPAACLKNGAWGPQNPDNTGQVYSGLCTNCPAIKGKTLQCFLAAAFAGCCALAPDGPAASALSSRFARRERARCSP